MGYEARAKVVKNRFAPSTTHASLKAYFATGICKEAALLALGLESHLLEKRGPRLYFGDQALGAGQNDAVRRLREEAGLAARLREALLERLKSEPGPPHDADAAT